MNASIRALTSSLAAGVLVACGGGGGGGSPPAPPPSQPAPPTITKAEAYRFLNQATFGATAAEAQSVMALGYEAWIDRELQRPASLELPYVAQAYATRGIGKEDLVHDDRVEIWLRNALQAP